MKIFAKAMSFPFGKAFVNKSCKDTDRTPPRVDQRAGCVGCGLGLFSCTTLTRDDIETVELGPWIQGSTGVGYISWQVKRGLDFQQG